MLKDCHILLSSLKSLMTGVALEDTKILRECCGGHGYSHFSGIPAQIEWISPNVTLEGDNTVMYMQAAV